jgi:hypothetical protein
MKPCPRIPPFINVSTVAEYEARRRISDMMKIYFNKTREGKSAGSGRLTALGACGRAIEYHYKAIY